MTVGPGKYDSICTIVREETKARVAIVIIIGGKHGSGFSVQGYGDDTLKKLPDALEIISAEIRKDAAMTTGVLAPWTDEQVAALNRFQKLDYVHPFTCPRDHEADRVLVAKTDGWHCPSCDYTQNWAHLFMFNDPPNPLDGLQ